jgi:small subunit ribosomal protein S6
MRNYELVCIIHPDLDETAFNAALDKIKGWVTDAGGVVSNVEVWGRRKLAYPLQKQLEGLYVLFLFQMDPAVTKDLERNIRYMEPVLRHMIVNAE